MAVILTLFLLTSVFSTLKSQKSFFSNLGETEELQAPKMDKGSLLNDSPFLSDRSKKQVNSHKNISDLLDNLLSGYDNSIRPDFGGAPAVVEVDIMVRSMGPISEIDMTYSMDLYFRQSWVDRRLAFQGDNKETLALSITMLEKIWKPDTYFYNGKQSYLHTITTPNKFVRLYQDGRVLYSSRNSNLAAVQFNSSKKVNDIIYITSADRRFSLLFLRLTIKAGCPMNLENFPMDTQRCPLKFGSFGYTTNDVIYKWNSQRQIVIAEDMKLSQFDLIANISANQTDKVNIAHSQFYTIKEYSMLLVSFHLQRHMGNFLIQVYGPCTLLVVLSWVSFWLNREATADRVSLGITTVLTMTFLGLEARTDLPKVPYPTALDFFVFLSFAFVFATIIQFAVVHYFTKYGSGECYFGMELSSESSSEEDEPQDQRRKTDSHNATSNQMVEFIPLSSYTVPSVRRLQRKKKGFFQTIKNIFSSQVNSIPFDRNLKLRSTNTSQNSRSEIDSESLHHPGYSENSKSCKRKTNLDQSEIPQQQTKNESRKLSINSLSENITQAFYSFSPPRSSRIGRKRRKRIPRYNSVSKIDKVSRIVFPILFAAINVLYWYSYLIRSERINRGNK